LPWLPLFLSPPVASAFRRKDKRLPRLPLCNSAPLASALLLRSRGFLWRLRSRGFRSFSPLPWLPPSGGRTSDSRGFRSATPLPWLPLCFSVPAGFCGVSAPVASALSLPPRGFRLQAEGQATPAASALQLRS